MQPGTSYSGQRILVTGGTGFLGAWIIRALVLKGYQVRAIRRATSELPSFIDSSILQKVEWVEGDILDITSLQEAMSGIDAVIHSAAIVSFLAAEREAMYATNINGTANVVNLCLELSVKRFVYISSVAALGRTSDGEQVNEKKSWEETGVHTHYAITKYRAEMEVWRAMAEGLEGVILNPSTIIGFGNWNNSSCAIFKHAYEEFPWYTNGVNGFIAVEDVASATIALLESNISTERFIINGANWSFRQLLNTIAAGFGKKPPHRQASRIVGQLAWRLEKIKSWLSGKKPLLTRESAKIAQSVTYYNSDKLLETLPGFRFSPLESAISESCRQYLAQHSR